MFSSSPGWTYRCPSLFLGGGDLSIFVTRPISATLSARRVVAVVGQTLATLWRKAAVTKQG
jgi:putative tricarboxylic transport membrane protein